jgi:hypothetical protein
MILMVRPAPVIPAE